jgi:hypothetical protein
MFNIIDIYIVIPVSGCVGRGPVHCFAQEPMMLLGRPWEQEAIDYYADIEIVVNSMYNILTGIIYSVRYIGFFSK